jgi:hypothetical protein
VSRPWCEFKPVVTVVDVLESGACIDGVKEYVAANGGVIAGPIAGRQRNEWIAKASHCYGDGSGDGSGYGSGSGYGYGYGSGSGDGYGSGDGDITA